MVASDKAVQNLTYLVARAVARKYEVSVEQAYKDLLTGLEEHTTATTVEGATFAMNGFMMALEKDISIQHYPQDAPRVFALKMASLKAGISIANEIPELAPS